VRLSLCPSDGLGATICRNTRVPRERAGPSGQSLFLERKAIKTVLQSETPFRELPLFPLNPGNSITFTVLLTTSSTFTLRGRIDQGEIVQMRDHSDEPHNETMYQMMKGR